MKKSLFAIFIAAALLSCRKEKIEPTVPTHWSKCGFTKSYQIFYDNKYDDGNGYLITLTNLSSKNDTIIELDELFTGQTYCLGKSW